MNANKFMEEVERYYGAYPEGGYVKGMVFSYIRKQPEATLEALLTCLFKNFSSQYGKVPDIAAIEKIREDNKETLDYLEGNYTDHNGKVFWNGVRIGHFDSNRFIPFLGDLTTKQIEYYAKNHISLAYPAAFGKWRAGEAKEIMEYQKAP